MANNESISISSETNKTVIGEKTRFKGKVETDKPIVIEGFYEGTIDSTGLVEISKTGYFSGILNCAELVLNGEINGKVNCTKLFRFATTGKFKGDAVAYDVDIHPGSDFDGTLKIER